MNTRFSADRVGFDGLLVRQEPTGCNSSSDTFWHVNLELCSGAAGAG